MIRFGTVFALVGLVATLESFHVSFAAAEPGATQELQELFATAHAEGAAVLLNVETGQTIAAVGVRRDALKPILPLSVIKLYVATIWWENGLEDHLTDPRHGRVGMRETLVNGWDAPAAEAAVRLRQKLGAERVLARLRALGLGAPPGSLTLTSDSDDTKWGNVLSIGESEITVTLEQVAQFVGTIGRRRDKTGARLRRAMLEAVTRGSAAAVANRLSGLHWQLGGKTGTGPAAAKPHYDGWFAGLIFEQHKPRYAICVYVPGRGLGGGVAAGIAADLTRWFAQRTSTATL